MVMSWPSTVMPGSRPTSAAGVASRRSRCSRPSTAWPGPPVKVSGRRCARCRTRAPPRVTGSPVSHFTSPRSAKVPLGEVGRSGGRGRWRGRGPAPCRRPRCGGTASGRRLVRACWIELPSTDQPLAGSEILGADVARDQDGDVPPVAAPSTSGPDPWRRGPSRNRSRPPAKLRSLDSLFPPSSSPPQAASVETRATQATAASDLLRFIVSSSSSSVPRTRSSRPSREWGPGPQRRVFGSTASRIASPSRLRLTTRITMPSSGCHRNCGRARSTPWPGRSSGPTTRPG